MGGLVLCLVVAFTRHHIRTRDNIAVTVCCSPLDDVLCATCCLCCVQSQLMRNEGMVGHRYKLVSPDGRADTEMV